GFHIGELGMTNRTFSWARRRLCLTALGLLMATAPASFLIAPAIAQIDSREFTEFADWCENREQLTPEAQHTVEMMLAAAYTEDCDRAQASLAGQNELLLKGKQIEDVSPLASLVNTNVREIWLHDNQITDITPLATLTDLQELWLSGNQIADIRPLAKLTNLTFLLLRDNQITDIRPLASLTELQILTVNGNQLEDIRPLANLANLQQLGLQDNLITDVSPLRSLTNLQQLALYNNPLRDRTCPVQPASVCVFDDPGY
ncbi:MAG: leucine-rich repeat domain-containing protein, partial [Spirulinaceae cyanobacterium]